MHRSNIGFKNAHDGLSLEIRQVLLFAQPVIGDAAKGLRHFKKHAEPRKLPLQLFIRGGAKPCAQGKHTVRGEGIY